MRIIQQLEFIRALCRAGVAVSVACVISVCAQHPFVQVTETGALGWDPIDFGASWGDFDGDGNLDIFCTSSYDLPSGGRRPNILYRNNGNGRFTRLYADKIGDLASDDGGASLGVWGDIDGDGDLDLYVANYADGNGFDPPSSPAADSLYLNDGTGFFSRHATAPLTTDQQRSGCVSLVDYDRDGLLDVFVGVVVPTVGSVPSLYHNNGGLQFTPTSAFSAQITPYFGAWGDFDSDGDLDLATGDFRGNRGSYLYVNESNMTERDAFSALTTFPNGTVLPPQGYGADWGDFDNDGDLDLLMPEPFKTGCDLFLNLGDGSFDWQLIPMQDQEQPASACWLDADNDGDLDFFVGGMSDSAPERISYFENNGTTGFREVLITGMGRFNGGPALADYDNDGFMDFFLVSYQGADYLAHNVGNENHWLKLVLKGTESNASAVGAVVRLKTTIEGSQTWQMRHVRAGSEAPYAQHDPRPNFGLGDALFAEMVRIEWPSGTVQEFTDVPADQILTVVEPPRLKVESGAQLSWPVTADGYRLESATSINGTWSETAETIEIDGSRKRVTIQPDGSSKFYRLNGL